MKAGKAGQNLIIRDQIAAFENLWGATVCCIVQKKLLFVCERKMLLCKVQNSIASRRLHYTLLLGSIFGMKSTFRLKKDFYLVFFFCLEEKKCWRRHICKKRTCRLAVSMDIFFKEGTTHYPGKNRNLLPCKKKSKR